MRRARDCRTILSEKSTFSFWFAWLSNATEIHVTLPTERQLGTYSQVVFDESRYIYHDVHRKKCVVAPFSTRALFVRACSSRDSPRRVSSHSFFGRVVGDGISWNNHVRTPGDSF